MYTNRFFVLLVIVALVSIAALTVQEAVATSSITSNPDEARLIEQSRAADAARWTAMGDYYQRFAEAQRLALSRAADAARWEAMGKYYQQLANVERARAADAARWTAMGEYYEQMNAAPGLTRAQTAEAARWTAMAEYYRLISPTR